MADTAVAVTIATSNTATADILTNAEGGTAVTTGNTAVIATNGVTRRLVISLYAASASTVVFSAGDEPPSELSGLGTDTVTVPAGDCVLYFPRAGQFAQDNGTIRGLAGANTVVFGAYWTPNNS